MFRGTAPLRRAAASFANRVVAATMSSGARRRGKDFVGAGPAVSWSGLCGPASPCDHTFSVAWMTSRRTGGVVAQLARPALAGLRCQTIRTAGPGGRIPAGGARVTPAIMPQPGPGPRDRVTPPCCGRGSVTRSFSGRRRWHRQQHWPHRSQINGGFDHQAAGRVGTTPSRGSGCRKLVCAAAVATPPAHAVVPQAPVVRQRPITAEDPAYAEDLGSSSCQNAPYKPYPPR